MTRRPTADDTRIQSTEAGRRSSTETAPEPMSVPISSIRRELIEIVVASVVATYQVRATAV